MLAKSNKVLGWLRHFLTPVSFLCVFAVPAAGAEFAAVGPIESLDCRAKRVRVLGIEFQAVKPTHAFSICASGKPYELLYVAIRGKESRSIVEIESFALISKGTYVPGATPVYIRGLVTATDSNTGEFAIRTAMISGSDATGLLNKNAELVGIQPNLGGLIVITPDSLSESRSLNFIGSDRLGALSSSGSGKLSSSGSGILSSSGSGKLSSSGSGKLSSSASGILSSSGSGKLSSSGSGKLS